MEKNPVATASVMPFRMKTAVFDEFAFPVAGNDSQIRCVVSFKGKTDAPRLLRAVRLVYDAEPILGCRFVNYWRGYFWQRLEPLDGLVPGIVIETDHMDSHVNRFLLSPMNPQRELPFQAALFRKDHDILCLKLCHMVSDAGGLKEIVYTISDIYEKLGDNPGYTPETNRKGDRSFRQVYRHFSLADRLKIVKRGLLNWKSDLFPRQGWTFPLEPGDLSDRELIIKRFDPKRFKALKAACARHHCTLHELFSAAVLRTLHQMIAPTRETPLRLGTSVDLRQYIPGGKGEALCNLSTFFLLNIGTDIGQSFGDTVKRVQQTLRPLKDDYFGLGFYQPRSIYFKGIMPSMWARWLFNRMIRINQRVTSGDVCPRLTNAGIIDESRLTFGGQDISDCYFTPPVCHPPVFMPGIISFRDTLSLHVGFSAAGNNREKIKCFINLLDDELKHVEGKD